MGSGLLDERTPEGTLIPSGASAQAVEEIVRRLAAAACLPPHMWSLKRDAASMTVTVSDRSVTFEFTRGCAGLQLEELATLFVAAIAAGRTREMLSAAGLIGGKPPLWLVRAPNALREWLCWSGAGLRFARGLRLAPEMLAGPIFGDAPLRVRRQGSSQSARLRVRRSVASGEVVLGSRPRCMMRLGETVSVSIEDAALPGTIEALLDRRTIPAGIPVGEIVDHPFLSTAGFTARGFAYAAGGLQIELETSWTTLAPLPETVSRLVPPGADPAAPWRATAQEVAALDAIVEAGREVLV